MLLLLCNRFRWSEAFDIIVIFKFSSLLTQVYLFMVPFSYILSSLLNFLNVSIFVVFCFLALSLSSLYCLFTSASFSRGMNYSVAYTDFSS